MKYSTKKNVVLNALREAISSGSYPVGSKLPSLAELSKKFRVSRGTVYNAMLQLSYEGYLYIVDRVGVFVGAPQKKNQNKHLEDISVILPSALGNFIGEMMKGIEEEVVKMNYHAKIFISDNDPEKEKRNLLSAFENDTKGIILFPVAYTTEYNSNCNLYLQIDKANVPIVILDYYLYGVPLDSVINNDEQSAYILTKHMINKGHKKLAFVGLYGRRSSCMERYSGFIRAIAESDVKMRPELMIPSDGEVFTLPEGADLAREFFKIQYKALSKRFREVMKDLKPTACFPAVFVGDFLEEFADSGVEFYGISFPADLGDSPQCCYAEINAFEMGNKAMKLLERRIKGDNSDKPVLLRVQSDIKYWGG